MSTLYSELSHKLVEQIQSGLIKAGEKLPSIRVLTERYGVSKNTVINALNQLEAQGFIEAKKRIGFFAKAEIVDQSRLPTQYFPKLAPQEASLSTMFHHVMAKGAAFDILPTEKLPSPSNSLLALNKYVRRAFREDIQYRSSHYDPPQGNLQLREQISLRYRLRNVNLTADDICITSGCQHGLMLALMAVCKAGDSVIVESPAFYGVLSLLEQLNLNAVEVSAHPVTGIDVGEMEKALSTLAIKACIVTPNFATPTGSLMPESHRSSLMALANQYDIAVIEDDIYGELSFRKPVKALTALDTENRVILVSSVSKSLSRDLRIGWIAGARWQKNIEQLKLVSQLASSSSIQKGLASFMAHGDYNKHLKQVIVDLAVQKQHLLSLLLSNWPAETLFTNPDGGLSLWVELSKEVNTQSLFQRLHEQGIVITPGMLFSYKNEYNHCLRLSFQHHFDQKRSETIKYIGQLLN